ncbi:MAG: DUF4349 domain-containing protein [Dehalococcoidales bacterium]|nr:DUF4349 domain-containing protein [Dehalococcoidales bacterium]
MKKLLLGLMVFVLFTASVACARSSEDVVYSEATEPSIVGISPGGMRPPAPTPTPAIKLPHIVATQAATAEQATVERMVIRSASLELVVEDVNNSIARITELADQYGGYVVNSNVYQERNRLYGNISLRVDAARFYEALRALRQLAIEVKAESTSGQDVTEEYIDLDARLRNLEASESQLLELMKRAGDVEEILKVQQELTRTREEIERTKARMKYLEESSALAYISVTLEQSKLSVDFNATARTLKEGQAIRFEANVSGGFTPYTYEWDFGDGTKGTEANPVHTYRAKGIFTVSLTVKDDKGHTASMVRENYITVISGWEAGNTARSAYKGLVALGHFFVDLFIWLGYLSPVWIIILLILYFAWWRRRRKSKQ